MWFVYLRMLGLEALGDTKLLGTGLRSGDSSFRRRLVLPRLVLGLALIFLTLILNVSVQ